MAVKVKSAYIDTDTLPTSYVNTNSANLAAAATSQQISDLETALSDTGTGLVARVIHISGNYVKVKWFLNKKPVGVYKARGHTLAKATEALEYFKSNSLATPTSAATSLALTIDDNTILIGGTGQLSAILTLADATTLDVTTKAYYTNDGTNNVSISAAGVVTGVEGNAKATTTLTSSGVNVTAADTVTIGNKTYTFRASVTTTANEVKIGADAATTLANLKAAINGAAGSGTTYGSLTTAHTQVDAGTITATTLVLTAKLGGTTANAYASTKSAVTLSFPGATFNSGTPGTAKTVVITGAYGGVSGTRSTTID